MPKKLKVKKCPLGITNKVKDKKCKECKHYNPKKWYTYKGPVDTFCDVMMGGLEKKYLKKK